MGKVHNWDVKLRNAATARVGDPFVWGETDCVSFVREMLSVMYDEDIVAREVGSTWTTKIGAARAYKNTGSFVEVLERLGATEVPITVMRDGDILVAESEPYDHIAIRAGGKTMLCSQKIGVYADNYMPGDNVRVYRL